MSLTVSVYYKTETGCMGEPLKPRLWKTKRPQDDSEWMALSNTEKGRRSRVDASGGKDLAGPEIWRTSVYESDVVRSFGLMLLPSLSSKDIWAVGEDIDRLFQEATVILERAEQVARETGSQVEDITFHVQNIKNAAMEARDINGGVVIW